MALAWLLTSYLLTPKAQGYPLAAISELLASVLLELAASGHLKSVHQVLEACTQVQG